MDAVDQAALVRRGDVSATELLDAAIERIESVDPHLNAVIIRWFDEAHRAAIALPDGPFRGVPFLLKDLWAHFAGQPLTNGCRALKDELPVSTADTTLVTRFRQAGLNIAGRTNSPEFGSLPATEPLAWGPTRNPWNLDHSPGGSSGGSAAAVAAGLVPFAHASDGGGSIRIPASCCGLVGLKPSQGRITLGPFRDESNLGVELCVSRTVRDTASLLDAVRLGRAKTHVYRHSDMERLERFLRERVDSDRIDREGHFAIVRLAKVRIVKKKFTVRRSQIL
jgi:amidase